MDDLEQYIKQLLLDAGFEDNMATDELIPTMIDTLFDRLVVQIEKKLHNADKINEFRALSEDNRPNSWLEKNITDFNKWLHARIEEFGQDYVARMKKTS